MNNNGERINKYNEILIKFLNDLVNSLNPNNELMVSLINDVTTNFSKQLAAQELEIAEGGVKTLLTNTFNEYIKILKYHFDHSDIHRIDTSHSENEDINAEVNQVTSNLTNAVNDMNKTPEYQDLIVSIRRTLINYFVQTFPNKNDVDSISEKIVNDCIISCVNNLSASKIEEFYRSTLPTLITICNDIVYVKPITEADIEQAKLKVNDERDAFIYENMDVEIEEGFENGVVTLSVTDSMGNTVVYSGRDAMEKLISYNQLFEASRPGKKADISKWEHLLAKMYEEDNLEQMKNENTIDGNSLGNMNNVDIMSNSNNSNNLIVEAPTAINNVIDISKLNNNVYNASNEEDEGINEVDELLNRISQNPFEVNNTSNDNYSSYNTNSISNTNDTTNNNISTSNNTFVFLPETKIEEYNTNVNEMQPTTNTLASNAFNDMISATKREETIESKDETKSFEFRNMMETKPVNYNNNSNNNSNNNNSNNEIYNGSFSFVPNFANPNQERNDFIKKATGIEIEEDIDNQGDLYLKVVEPTGREQIYTGKEAVNMIRNYNRTYLDANPGKTIDTSLIDKFNNMF